MSRGTNAVGRSTAKLAGIVAVMAAVMSVAPDADAQVASRFALRLEGGVGTMLSSHQSDPATVGGLGYDGLGFQGSVRLGFTIVGPLVLQASLANWWFPSSNTDPVTGESQTGRVLAPMGGLRIEPRLGTVGRLFLDGNVGLAFTGDDKRLTFDAGLGFEFAVTRWLGIGPAVRLGMVFQQSEVDGIPTNFPDANAMFWSGGLSLALRVPEDEVAAVRDTDNDGVMDPDDMCVDTPQGDHPDPSRRGCPIADTDGDGVYDNEDLCVNEPAGATPDPARRGCPISDRDGDGVPDAEDQCPTEPQGAAPDPSRRGCPRADTDHDGVFDDEDQCVSEPAGARPSTTRRGCPAPDADHDGIIDQPEGPDRCPTQPETFNGRDDEDGCPDGESLAIAEGNSIRILQQVNFRTNSDVIVGRQSFQVLDSVISILRAMSNLQVDVQGHTDDVGDAAHNLDLSNRRALSVRRYLTEHGVVESRLEGHGFGPNCPLIPGTTRAARAANRRVQFVIVTADTPAGRCANAAPAGAGPAAIGIAPIEEPTGRHGRHGGRHGGGHGGSHRRRH
jgi:outer membrane protein OmpA-like peptidoglycan-associated protein